jgi:hypothetical protein
MTSAEFAQRIEDIKAAILTTVRTELIPSVVTIGERIPKVINRLIVERQADKWASKLTSSRDIDDQEKRRVHAVMVGYGGISPGPNNTVGSMVWRLRFTLDSYLQDEFGTDTDNAEKRHNDEITRMAFALRSTRHLGLPQWVRSVGQLSERRGLARMGEIMVRESLGEMVVELQPIHIVQ